MCSLFFLYSHKQWYNKIISQMDIIPACCVFVVSVYFFLHGVALCSGQPLKHIAKYNGIKQFCSGVCLQNEITKCFPLLSWTQTVQAINIVLLSECFFFIIRYWSVNVVNMSPPSKGCSLVKHFVCCCNCPTLELAIMTDAALGHIFNMYNMSKQFFSPLCHGCDSVSTCRTAWADPLT